jgi:nicotinamidase-related amidase
VTKFDAAALVIIDVQQAIDADYHSVEGPRNHPQAEARIASLLDKWRREGRPIIHIRHDSCSQVSAYQPGQPGNAFKNEVSPISGELVIPKTTNSAFIGTDLEAYLRRIAVHRLVVVGVATNNSVETTVRMAGNMGFDTYLVEDCCFTFARRDFAGRLRTAEEVQAMSLANLKDEYCTVISSALLL